MLKDRGNKKWIPLMLVEHRDGLRKIWEHEDDVDMPVLDEQKIEEIDRVLHEAIEGNKLVEVTYYQDNRNHTTRGIVKAGDRCIIVGKLKIPFRYIIDIKIIF